MSLIHNFPTFAQGNDESYLYDVDFSERIEFASRGAAITGTPTVTKNATGGTFSSLAVSSSVVQIRFTNPVAGSTYGIKVQIATDQGDVINGFFNVTGIQLS